MVQYTLSSSWGQASQISNMLVYQPVKNRFSLDLMNHISTVYPNQICHCLQPMLTSGFKASPGMKIKMRISATTNKLQHVVVNAVCWKRHCPSFRRDSCIRRR